MLWESAIINKKNAIITKAVFIMKAGFYIFMQLIINK